MMKICPMCKVRFPGNEVNCPLCGAKLRQNAAASAEKAPTVLTAEIPKNRARLGWNRLPKLQSRSLISVLLVMVGVVAGLFYQFPILWLLFAAGAILVAWGSMLLDRRFCTERIAEHVAILNFCFVVVARLADRVFRLGNGSLDYFIPILGITSVVSFVVSAVLNDLTKRSGHKEYAFFLLANSGAVACMLVRLFWADVPVVMPTLIYAVASFVVLIMFLLIERKSLFSFIRRKVHV